MSKIKTTNSPIKNFKNETQQPENSNKDGMFEFFARIVKLRILSLGDPNG
jgi:hypothetical protein